MSNGAHTSGPWRWSDGVLWHEHGTVAWAEPVGSDGDRLCVVVANPGDPALIAAAPDLLAALQLAAQTMEEQGTLLPLHQQRVINAAINKATGGSR